MQRNRHWQQWSPKGATAALVIATMFAIVAGLPDARAQDKAAAVTDMGALRAAVKADKHAFVASTLGLSDAEAKRFWPIYDAYQAGLEASNRRRVVALEGLVFSDTAMTNLAAKNLINELMAIDEAGVKARHRLRNRLMRALPAVKAARYLQLEDKIQAVRDYDVASSVPLIH